MTQGAKHDWWYGSRDLTPEEVETFEKRATPAKTEIPAAGGMYRTSDVPLKLGPDKKKHPRRKAEKETTS